MAYDSPDDLTPVSSGAPIVPDLVPPDPSFMTPTWTASLSSHEMTLYRKVLGLPWQLDVKAAVLDDLKEYLALDVEDWVNRISAGHDWQGREPRMDASTEATIAGLPVDSLEARAFALLWRSYLQATGGVYPTPVIVSRAMRPPSASPRCLDLGSGIGDMGQLLLALGYTVDVADVSPQLLQFARWRLGRRGQELRFINLREEDLSEAEYDTIVVRDVFANVSRPGNIVPKLTAALRHDGMIITNIQRDPPSISGNNRRKRDESKSHESLIRSGFMLIEHIDEFIAMYASAH
jgi:2-polyprenyl-3-methyl-5-hydroxy-6-metoxy-1,4-benzoquinol methylase